MSIREWEAPDFSNSLRGYHRGEVDEYLALSRDYTIQVEERAAAAEAALLECRRELVSSPGTAGISQRLAALIHLANEEADEIRARARADSDTTTRQAATQAEHTISDTTQQRDAIQREIDELSSVREELLARLIELGGTIFDATERYQGPPPGASLPPPDDVALLDAEAVDDDVAVGAGPAADPDVDTERITSTD
jgi:cell division septum initiation protein DivIVA